MLRTLSWKTSNIETTYWYSSHQMLKNIVSVRRIESYVVCIIWNSLMWKGELSKLWNLTNFTPWFVLICHAQFQGQFCPVTSQTMFTIFTRFLPPFLDRFYFILFLGREEFTILLVALVGSMGWGCDRLGHNWYNTKDCNV